MGRTHQERLRFELDQVRTELKDEAGRLQPEEVDWAPADGMKSFRALLLEIGTMERICVHWLRERQMLGWEEAWSALGWTDDRPESGLAALDAVRQDTLQYLAGCTEERLQALVSLPPDWHGYFGAAEVEPEEMLRWVTRHEYYHLGQIITYRWIRGDNPYKR